MRARALFVWLPLVIFLVSIVVLVFLSTFPPGVKLPIPVWQLLLAIIACKTGVWLIVGTVVAVWD
jgi:hypothetical protein